jgi:hypothetical protein
LEWLWFLARARRGKGGHCLAVAVLLPRQRTSQADELPRPGPRRPRARNAPWSPRSSARPCRAGAVSAN